MIFLKKPAWIFKNIHMDSFEENTISYLEE